MKNIKNVRSENETYYKIIYENIMDAVLLTSPDGHIYFANAAASDLFGMSEEEICRLGRDGIVDQSDLRLDDLLKDRDLNGKATGELTLRKKTVQHFQPPYLLPYSLPRMEKNGLAWSFMI